jgi:hypothetical protein
VPEKTRPNPLKNPRTATALVLGASAVYLAHFFPLSVYLLAERLPWSLAALAAILAARWGLRRRAPRAFSAARVVYYAAVAVYVALAFLLTSLIDLRFAVAAVVALAVAGVVMTRTRRRLAPFYALMVAPVLMGVAAGGDLAIIAGVAGAVAVLMAYLRAGETLPRVALVACAAVALFGARVAVFYVANPTDRIPEIVAQAGVEPIFTYADADEAWLDEVGCCLQYAAPDCSGRRTLVASHRGVFVHGEGAARRLVWGKAFDNPVLDCDAGRIFIGDFDERRLIELATPSLTFRRDKVLDTSRLTQLAFDPAGPTLFLLGEYDKNVPAVAAGSLETERVYAEAGQQDLIIDRAGGSLISTSIAQVRVLDLETGEGKGTIDLGFSLRLAADTVARRLFVSSFTAGTITAFDLDSLKPLGTVKLARGVRYVAYAPSRGVLLAGGFFDGELTVIDGATLTVRRTLYLGPRIRWLQLAPDESDVFVTSATGAYRLDLAEISKPVTD